MADDGEWHVVKSKHTPHEPSASWKRRASHRGDAAKGKPKTPVTAADSKTKNKRKGPVAKTASLPPTTPSATPRRNHNPKGDHDSSDDAHDDDDEDDDDDDDEDDDAPDPLDEPVPPYHTTIFSHCPFENCSSQAPFLDTTSLVGHIRNEHHMVFKNLHHMYMALDAYLSRWAKELESRSLEDVGVKDSEQEVYVIDPEHCTLDKTMRDTIQREKLESVLKIQQLERQHGAHQTRKCLFCKISCDNRSSLFRHMFSEHNFNIGLPDNLVYVDEFLDLLQEKLTRLQCLYCEKTFTNAPILRKHMRKKKHFKISSKNRQYDRFYVINYLEPGKNWEHFENDNCDSDDDKKDESWADWEEDETEPTMCLFDQEMLPSPQEAFEHMKVSHGFDLYQIKRDLELDFYKMVVLVNYIRHKSSLARCFACDEQVNDLEDLVPHMNEKGCFTRPLDKNADFWKDPSYLLPTYENDPLITGFEDESDLEDDVDLPDDEANSRYLSKVMSRSLAIADEGHGPKTSVAPLHPPKV